MEIYTLNVGQGQFVVVCGKDEAFIVDSYIPLSTEQNTIFAKSALAKILNGKNMIGLVVTGFDSDHFCEPGLKIILNKYLPDWLMYPSYFKNTDEADSCFNAIRALEKRKTIKRVSVKLEENEKRFYTKLSKEFSFEIFSPNKGDMNSSNNCSIVCKVKELATGATYLITGDTEGGRWNVITNEFGSNLKADVLAAPHHGSENGLTKNAAKLILPHTILVSAGINNQYGHPHTPARELFRSYAKDWYATNSGEGQSLRTVANGQDVKTYLFKA